jgi:hypothetical protein
MNRIFSFLFVILAGLSMNSCQKTCEEGYTGSNCDVEKPPVKMTISKITVNNFNANDPNGSQWDIGSGADMYVVVTGENTTNEIWRATTYFEDAENTASYSFNPTTPIDILYPTMTYNIVLFDNDGGTFINPDDQIGVLPFKPYQSGTFFPNVLTFTSGDISVDVTVTYAW